LIRIFNVYYPLRTVVLLGGEAAIIFASFLLAVVLQLGPDDSFLVLNYESGYLKILAITAGALLFIYYFDLYDLQKLRDNSETFFRLLLVVASLSFVLSGMVYFFPAFRVGGAATAGRGIFLVGLSILTLALVCWRVTYWWLIQQPFLQEKVYVLGSGEKAVALKHALQARRDLGLLVLGGEDSANGDVFNRESLGTYLISLWQTHNVERIIVALNDRRGTMPVNELLQLRVRGIKIDDATSVLEKITGKIDVDQLNPSWLIFSEGFRLSDTFLAARRIFSLVVSLILLVLVLPLIPLIMLGIKLTSAGPVLYSQKRVGKHGSIFNCYKFRTMRADAEADTGPTWANDDDPRITGIGKFLRSTRLDEIPQLWNVLRGDMGFVGPRPERPEFVEWLSKEIPYYNLRHLIRPGITGWAQVCYEYGSSMEQAKEKLRYDLYYIKNISLSFDLYIAFQTIKIVIFGRGAR